MSTIRSALSKFASPSSLRKVWSSLRSVPGGGRIMGSLIGRLAPYTGTISPEILSLDQGYSKVLMRDTRKVRNHLNSVHAIALLNLGEVATGKRLDQIVEFLKLPESEVLAALDLAMAQGQVEKSGRRYLLA